MRLIALFLCILLSGCATASKLNKISLGMTKEQVISVMGTPDTIMAEYDPVSGLNQEALAYFLLPSSTSNQKELFYIRLTDGIVEKFGAASTFKKNENKGDNYVTQIQNNIYEPLSYP